MISIEYKIIAILILVPLRNSASPLALATKLISSKEIKVCCQYAMLVLSNRFRGSGGLVEKEECMRARRHVARDGK